MSWAAIAGFRIVAADPERLARFYAAIGFEIGAAVPISRADMAMLRLPGRGERRPMTLGAARVSLDAYEARGRPYPDAGDAASLAFQHLAIVTDDAAAAWARAAAAGATAISRRCPVTLPKSSGGATAIKFRDPEGHPLEFLQFADAERAGWRGTGTLGIDHSAISVSDTARSLGFYGERGLRRGDATVNRGPEQAALDGLDSPVVDVVPMLPGAERPHLELLGYRTPAPAGGAVVAANDVAATRIVWRAGEDGLARDPDGHLHELRAEG